MTPIRLIHSVVLRLLACLVVGGVLLSLGLGFLELRRATKLLELEMTQRIVQTTHNLQASIGGLLAQGSDKELHEALHVYLRDTWLRGIRVTGDQGTVVEAGAWLDALPDDVKIWTLAQYGATSGAEIDITSMTLVRAPIMQPGRVLLLEVMIDGPAVAGQLRAKVISGLAMQWLLMGVLTLFGLLLVRRWFIGPLSDIVNQVQQAGGAERFYDLSRRSRGEFAQLAEAIGGMLTRIDATAQCLRQRERAFEDLYQFAPAAMLSLDPLGKVVDANRRAAQLLGAASERVLVGMSILDLVRPEDRARARQTIDRLELEPLARCELRLQTGGKSLDVILECAGVRNEEGALRQVRVSFLDVTQSRQLQSELAEKGRLLNLIVDHMSDGILLVDKLGRIAAYNQKLATLLRCRVDQRIGMRYEPEHFWNDLGVLDAELFVKRMKQIEADTGRPAMERFATQVGVFTFEGIPVHDVEGQTVGRLWVVQDISHQEQIHRLAGQQNAQLQALRNIGEALAGVATVDELLERAVSALFECMGVETVGLAVRRDRPGARTQQLIHRGPAPVMLSQGRALIEVVEKELLGQVLGQVEAMYWPEPSMSENWGKLFRQLGLTSVAAVGLRGSSEGQGILWIARRGGERLERHQIYMMQALAPVIAARVEFAQQRERLQAVAATDVVTDLPNAQQFHAMLRRMAHLPGQPWSVLLVKLDHFRKINHLLDHDHADKVLHDAAKEVRRLVRKSAFVARLPGPVFGIVAPDTDQTQALTLAQRLHEAFAYHEPIVTASVPCVLTLSIGIVTHPTDQRSLQELWTLAELRLEQARAEGGNRTVAATASKRQAV